MARVRTLLTAVLSLAVLTACEEAETILNPPDSGPPTLSEDVQPILDLNCAFSGCHGSNVPNPPGKPMVLEEGATRANTVNVSSAQLPTMDRIEPGDPDESYLVHKIEGTHLQVGGSGNQMPENLPPLSSGQIEVIRDWIADGARNN